MESGEVEGTIKCKIPKSLGATVQTLNNKTDILSDRIEAIEGLKSSQNMKYETDKGYLVCKETKNGVIDDLKLEGKTLVNLFKCDTNSGLFVVNRIDKNRFKQGKYTVVCLNDKPVGVEIKRISDNGWVHNYTIKPNQGSILIELSENCYIADIYGTSNNG